ncbi:bpb/poz domain-containing protein [Aphelenchoides avenae]|nr:bpb/poz domain-containing protein [Aphelenchus avenae]
MRPSGWPNTRDYTKWFFNFSVSTRVRIHGVAIFGRKSVSSDYEVNVSLLNASSGESLAITQRTTTTDASEDTYKVLFECPVLIAPCTRYKITAVSIGPPSMYAENGLREVKCVHVGNSATFSFTDTQRRDNDQFDVSLRGHIPVIYFSFA